MKLLKNLMLGLISCSISLMFFSTTFAQSNDRVITSKTGTTVTFTVAPNVNEKLAVKEMQALADANPNAGHITIQEIGFVDSEQQPLSLSQKSITISPMGHWLIDYVEDPVISYTSKNVFESDRFVDSCAKGETKTVKYELTESLKLDYSGDLYGSLGLKGSITYVIEKGKELVGPPEGSLYNTREFRVKFYENKGTWSQKTHLHDGRVFTETGTFTEPNRYVSYSIDRVI